jgi:transcriptional regulator with XRE-family HTH domain
MNATYVKAPQSVGSILREARKRLKLGQEEAADSVGVTRTTVSNHERGFSTPDGELLHRYAKLYKLPVHELMDAAGEAPSVTRMSQAALVAMFAILLNLAKQGVDESRLEALHQQLLDPSVRARLAALPVGATEEERVIKGMRFLAVQLLSTEKQEAILPHALRVAEDEVDAAVPDDDSGAAPTRRRKRGARRTR